MQTRSERTPHLTSQSPRRTACRNSLCRRRFMTPRTAAMPEAQLRPLRAADRTTSTEAAIEFFRDKGLNANDPFIKARRDEKPVATRNQFGGTLGGHVVADRVFFFGSYQGTREDNGVSLTNSLTSPVLPAGLRDDEQDCGCSAGDLWRRPESCVGSDPQREAPEWTIRDPIVRSLFYIDAVYRGHGAAVRSVYLP